MGCWRGARRRCSNRTKGVAGNDRGTPNWSLPALKEIALRLDAAGFQIHMHGIGDRAIREGLDALADVRDKNGPSDLLHHIAHLELVDPADIPRLAALGVFANFQPFWMFADASITENIEPLIGAARTARLYEIRAFEQAGTRIVAGSDWPVSTANPFLAIEVGMTRRDPTDAGASVWNPAQRVSLDTLLRAYTIEGATLNHREQDTGLARGREGRRFHHSRSRPVRDPARGHRRDAGARDLRRRRASEPLPGRLLAGCHLEDRILSKRSGAMADSYSYHGMQGHTVASGQSKKHFSL